MTGTLYFVAHFKRGEMTHLLSGPFIDWERAEADRQLLIEDYTYPLKVVKTTLQLEEGY